MDIKICPECGAKTIYGLDKTGRRHICKNEDIIRFSNIKIQQTMNEIDKLKSLLGISQ